MNLHVHKFYASCARNSAQALQPVSALPDMTSHNKEEQQISPEEVQKQRDFQEEAIRFSTLEKICEALDCEPGDILKFSKETK